MYLVAVIFLLDCLLLYTYRTNGNKYMRITVGFCSISILRIQFVSNRILRKLEEVLSPKSFMHYGCSRRSESWFSHEGEQENSSFVAVVSDQRNIVQTKNWIPNHRVNWELTHYRYFGLGSDIRNNTSLGANLTVASLYHLTNDQGTECLLVCKN